MNPEQTQARASRILPPVQTQTFVGQRGLSVEVRESFYGGWVWRIADRGGEWQDDAESLAEALCQASEALGMTQIEAEWAEVGGEAAAEELVESTTWRAFAGSYSI